MKTVLIVEDNDLNRKLFCDILRYHEYSVLEATDSVSCYEQMAECRPDLIIMDIQLPGVSGLEITKHLKTDATFAAIPVIAVTAFAMRGDEERIRQAGCEEYLAKPISLSSFLTTVKRYA